MHANIYMHSPKTFCMQKTDEIQLPPIAHQKQGYLNSILQKPISLF